MFNKFLFLIKEVREFNIMMCLSFRMVWFIFFLLNLKGFFKIFFGEIYGYCKYIV